MPIWLLTVAVILAIVMLIGWIIVLSYRLQHQKDLYARSLHQQDLQRNRYNELWETNKRLTLQNEALTHEVDVYLRAYGKRI